MRRTNLYCISCISPNLHKNIIFVNCWLGTRFFSHRIRIKSGDILIFQIELDFPELLHCQQPHRPTAMVVRKGRRVSRDTNNKQQQSLMSSRPASLSTKCPSNEAQIEVTTVTLKTTHRQKNRRSLGLVCVKSFEPNISHPSVSHICVVYSFTHLVRKGTFNLTLNSWIYFTWSSGKELKHFERGSSLKENLIGRNFCISHSKLDQSDFWLPDAVVTHCSWIAGLLQRRESIFCRKASIYDLITECGVVRALLHKCLHSLWRLSDTEMECCVSLQTESDRPKSKQARGKAGKPRL